MKNDKRVKSILISCHTTGQAGGVNTLHEYLQSEGYDTYMLFHPLNDYKNIPTTLELPNHEIETYHRKERGLINLFGDLLLSMKFIRRLKSDVFIGSSNFDTLPALICRLLRIQNTRLIIFYPRDYAEGRFTNAILNKIYRGVETFVVKRSDFTISNTKRSELKRFEHGLLPSKSLVIPNPVNIHEPAFRKKRIRKNFFVYAGDISVEHGLYDLVEALGPLITKLVVIGSGPDWSRIQSLLALKNISTEIMGELPQRDVIRFLQEFSGFGLAPYTLHSQWTHYASPLKVSEYIGCGLPVLMSDIPEIAEEVTAKQLGVVYKSLDVSGIKAQLESFDTDNFAKRAEKFYESAKVHSAFARLPL